MAKKVLVRQKGFYEKLLCSVCEQRISKWENYAEKLIFGGNIEFSDGMNSREFFAVNDLDYESIKLFQISVLWRAAVSTLPIFSEVNLAGHVEHLRNMIIGNNPGLPEEYGCLMTVVILGDGLLDGIRKPDQIEIDGIRCVRFVMGGLMWVYVISQSAGDFCWKSGFIQPNGQLVVLKDRAENLEFFLNDIERLKGRSSDVLRAALGRKLRGL